MFAPTAGDGPPVAKKQKRRKREIVGQLRSFKVRMIPTSEQKTELKRCFAAARHAYNHTVTAINDEGARANFYERRSAYKASPSRPAWAEGVSKRFVDGGIEQATNAFKSNFAKRDKDHTHTFDVHRISHRKTKTEVLRVEGDGDAMQKNSPLLSFRPVPVAGNADLRSECLALFGCNLKPCGGIRMQDKPKVIDRMLAEGGRLRETCRIQWEKRTNQFYFIYVYDLPAQPDPDPEFETKRLVATDPGVRTFQTYYSPTSGEVGQLLVGETEGIERRCFAIDRLTSKVTKRGNREYASAGGNAASRSLEQRRRTFRSLKRKLARDRLRLCNHVAYAHYSAANRLLRRFDVVISPHLETQRLVPRDGRVLNSRVARKMLTWSFGLFRARLHSAAFRYAGRHVLSDTGEPGTTKTCNCGHWHADLGARSVFHCPRCGIRMSRDVNGARNNFFAAYGRARGVGWDGVQY